MGCKEPGLYCFCEPSTEWKGIMELEQCYEKCKDYNWFIHATYGNKNCKCVLETATCGMNPTSAEYYRVVLYKNLRKSKKIGFSN